MSNNKGKLAVNTGYYEMEVREYDIPKPDQDSLVIKIESFCICGSDQHLIQIKDHAPGVEGHEFMGRIISMGENANKTIHSYGGELHIGDRIAVYPHITCGKCDSCMTYGDGVCGTCDNDYIYGGVVMGVEGVKNPDPEQWPHFKGGFSEYCYIFPGTYVWKVPDDMPGEIAALIDPLAVAMRAVEQTMTNIGGLNEGFSTTSRCLVVGAGAIGIMTAMIFKAMGAKQVIITDFVDEKLKLAKEISKADIALNVSAMTSDERIERIYELTEGGANIVVNCANHPSSCVEALQMVRKLGTYVEIGNSIDFGSGTISEINMAKVIFEKNAHITSVVANTPSCFNRAFELLKRWREYPFDKLLTHRFHSLDDIVTVMKQMRDKDFIKAVCTFEK